MFTGGYFNDCDLPWSLGFPWPWLARNRPQKKTRLGRQETRQQRCQTNWKKVDLAWCNPQILESNKGWKSDPENIGDDLQKRRLDKNLIRQMVVWCRLDMYLTRDPNVMDWLKEKSSPDTVDDSHERWGFPWLSGFNFPTNFQPIQWKP